MVKKHLLSSFLMFGTCCYPQNEVVVVNYDFYLNLGHNAHYNSKLLLTPKKTLFLWGKPTGPAIEEGEFDLSINLSAFDSIGSYTYTKRSVDSMYTRVPHLDQKSFMVKELIPPIKWSIGEQARKIGPYNCQDAVGSFRGREYTVWFTYDIPISSGPWKLQGLPGLIISGKDASGQIQFIFKSITNSNEILDPNLTDGQPITIEEFAELQRNLSDEFSKRIKSKFPRGSNIEITATGSMEYFDGKE